MTELTTARTGLSLPYRALEVAPRRALFHLLPYLEGLYSGICSRSVDVSRDVLDALCPKYFADAPFQVLKETGVRYFCPRVRLLMSSVPFGLSPGDCSPWR